MSDKRSTLPSEPADEPLDLGEFSSPPCLRHELDPTYFGAPAPAGPADASTDGGKSPSGRPMDPKEKAPVGR